MRHALFIVSAIVILCSVVVVFADEPEEVKFRRFKSGEIWSPTLENWERVKEKHDIEHLRLFDFDKSIEDEKLTPEQIAPIRKLNTLQSLEIGPCNDAGLKHIAPLTNLKVLIISGGEDVTDKCVKTLTKLPALKVIGFYDTSITERGLERLRQHFPKAIIESYDLSMKQRRPMRLFDGNGCPSTEGRRLMWMTPVEPTP